MHVGLILEHSNPRRGGAERYAVALAERLRVHGHKLSAMSRTGPAQQPVPRSISRSARPGYYQRTFLPKLRDAGAEVVLTFQPVPECDFYQPHAGIRADAVPPRLETVSWRRRFVQRWEPLRRWRYARLRRWEARTVRPPTRVLALSPRVVEGLRRHHPQAAPAVLLRSGVDLERFTPARLGEREEVREALGIASGPLLLFVAHDFALKGLRTAIRALPHLPGMRLVVVGDGRGRRYRRLAKELRVDDRVRWLGYVEDLARLYRSVDLLVHPTHYDTASLVVLEALASGTPPITTVRDGNADLAQAGGGAALSRPGDPALLCEAVLTLLATSRSEAADRARAGVEEYPLAKMLDRVVETLTGSGG